MEDVEAPTAGAPVVRGAALFGARYLLTTVASAAAAVLFARWLSPSQYGVYAQLSFFVLGAAGTVVGDLGIGVALVRAHREPLRQEWGAALTAALGLASAALAASGVAAVYFAFEGRADVAVWVALLGCGLATRFTRTVPSARLQRAHRFGSLALAEAAESAVYFGLALTLVGLGYGVSGLVIGLFAKELTGATGTWLAAGAVPRPSRNLGALRPYLGIGTRSQLTALLTSSTDAFQPIAIGFILGASSLGYVSWTYALILVPVLLIATADRVLVPALARVQGSREVLVEWVGRAMRAGSLVGVPSALVLLLCAHQLVLVVFGPRWLPAEDLIRYFAPSVAAVAFFTPILHAFTATGAVSVPLRLAALWAVLTWSVGTLAVVLFGITGYGVFYVGLQLTYAWPAALAVRRLELNLATVSRAPVAGAVCGVIGGVLAPSEATAQALGLRVTAICVGFLVGFVLVGGRAAVADVRLLTAAFRRGAVSRPA